MNRKLDPEEREDLFDIIKLVTVVFLLGFFIGLVVMGERMSQKTTTITTEPSIKVLHDTIRRIDTVIKPIPIVRVRRHADSIYYTDSIICKSEIQNKLSVSSGSVTVNYNDITSLTSNTYNSSTFNSTQKLDYLYDTLKYNSRPFTAFSYNIFKTDTIDIKFNFPEMLFDIEYRRHADSIFKFRETIYQEIIKTIVVERNKEWYETPIVQGVATGVVFIGGYYLGNKLK